MGEREQKFAELIVKKLEKRERVTFKIITERAKKSGLDLNEVIAHLISLCEILLLTLDPAIAAFLDDAAKKAAEFKSWQEYLEHLARQKGFKSDFKYKEYLAKKNGFKSSYEYAEYMVSKRGFTSFYEYLKHMASKKGFKSWYSKRKFDAGTRFVAIVRSLEELGMPKETAIAQAERVIKFPTKEGKKRALQLLEKARKKGV